MKYFGPEFTDKPEPFDDYVLGWCIRGELKNDLLSHR